MKETQLFILKKLLTKDKTASGCKPVSIAEIAEELGKKRGKGPLKETSVPVYLHELKECGAQFENVKIGSTRKRTHVKLLNPDDFEIPMYRANAKIEIVEVTTKPKKRNLETLQDKIKEEDVEKRKPKKEKPVKKKKAAKKPTSKKVTPAPEIDSDIEVVNTSEPVILETIDDADFNDIEEFEESTGIEFDNSHNYSN